MERDQNTDRGRVFALVALALVGFVLGLVIVWLYWLRRLTERGVVEAEEVAPLRVRASPPAHELDDLTRIEGIGPKFSGVLRSAGISTYEQLTASDVDELRDILRERRVYFADPTTWPEQAGLAAVGAWDALHELQEELTAGRRS